MPIYTDVLPQVTLNVKTTSIIDLIKALPDTISYSINVWLTGNIVRYGITSDDTIIFLGELDTIAPQTLINYFKTLVSPLGINATFLNEWKSRKFNALRIYNNGRLIINKDTLAYTEVPSPIHVAPVITLDDFVPSLPKTIPWAYTIYLTGGMTKVGWSANDIDMIIFDKLKDPADYMAMRRYFTKTLGYIVDIGNSVITEKEPVYLYKLYENGSLVQH